MDSGAYDGMPQAWIVRSSYELELPESADGGGLDSELESDGGGLDDELVDGVPHGPRLRLNCPDQPP